MLIVAFKLFITPLLIGSVTLAGRRWGAIVSGLMIGLPLTSGPISLILALEYGPDFAGRSAVGNLAGQISNCIFCLTYIGAARLGSWKTSAVSSLAAFFASTFVLNLFAWQAWNALAVLLVVIVLSACLLPRQWHGARELPPSKWDLPARIACATGLVVLLTSVADGLGPQLSGLLSPFPAFSLIFAAFSHAQHGAEDAASLLRGVIVGSGGYAAFFSVVWALLPAHGIAATYLVAALASMAIGAITLFLARRERRGLTAN